MLQVYLKQGHLTDDQEDRIYDTLDGILTADQSERIRAARTHRHPECARDIYAAIDCESFHTFEQVSSEYCRESRSSDDPNASAFIDVQIPLMCDHQGMWQDGK